MEPTSPTSAEPLTAEEREWVRLAAETTAWESYGDIYGRAVPSLAAALAEARWELAAMDALLREWLRVCTEDARDEVDGLLDRTAELVRRRELRAARAALGEGGGDG